MQTETEHSSFIPGMGWTESRATTLSNVTTVLIERVMFTHIVSMFPKFENAPLSSTEMRLFVRSLESKKWQKLDWGNLLQENLSCGNMN